VDARQFPGPCAPGVPALRLGLIPLASGRRPQAEQPEDQDRTGSAVEPHGAVGPEDRSVGLRRRARVVVATRRRNGRAGATRRTRVRRSRSRQPPSRRSPTALSRFQRVHRCLSRGLRQSLRTASGRQAPAEQLAMRPTDRSEPATFGSGGQSCRDFAGRWGISDHAVSRLYVPGLSRPRNNWVATDLRRGGGFTRFGPVASRTRRLCAMRHVTQRTCQPRPNGESFGQVRKPQISLSP
jgi:hypothetical protein